MRLSHLLVDSAFAALSLAGFGPKGSMDASSLDGVLSPIDGRVASISVVSEFCGAPGPFIAISMVFALFDSRAVRAPVTGLILKQARLLSRAQDPGPDSLEWLFSDACGRNIGLRVPWPKGRAASSGPGAGDLVRAVDLISVAKSGSCIEVFAPITGKESVRAGQGLWAEAGKTALVAFEPHFCQGSCEGQSMDWLIYRQDQS